MNTPRHGGARSPVIVLLFAALSSAHQTAQNIRLLFNANGIRIPLEVLPNTAHTLPIPAIPTTP
jgi:hypothetical protein